MNSERNKGEIVIGDTKFAHQLQSDGESSDDDYNSGGREVKSGTI